MYSVHTQTGFGFGCVYALLQMYRCVCVVEHECSTSLLMFNTENTLLRSIVLSPPIACIAIGYLCCFLCQALACALACQCMRVQARILWNTLSARLMFMHVMCSSYIAIQHNTTAIWRACLFVKSFNSKRNKVIRFRLHRIQLNNFRTCPEMAPHCNARAEHLKMVRTFVLHRT